ncbi:hypothetical protein F4X33_10515 [Candidatus Poribacteria bacterium]|nr:hypothetical protein [Candidatus Poribacteria bacterium]
MGRPRTCECGTCPKCKARVRQQRKTARDKLEAQGLGPLARKGEVITPVAVQPDMAEVVDAVDGLDDSAEAVLLERMARRREMAAIAAGERPSGATLALIGLRPDPTAPVEDVREAFDKQAQGWADPDDGRQAKRKRRRQRRDDTAHDGEADESPASTAEPPSHGCERCGDTAEPDVTTVLGSTMRGTWLQVRCQSCGHEWRRLWKFPT